MPELNSENNLNDGSKYRRSYVAQDARSLNMTPQRLIVVDDTDDKIQYSGPWELDPGYTGGDFGDPYNGTAHRAESDASFTFQFNGKSPTFKKSGAN